MTDRLEWEALLTSVGHALPQPVAQETAADGSIVLVGGEPGEVVVRLTRSSALVSEYAVARVGPHETVPRPIAFGSVRWRRMPEPEALSCLNTLIHAARDSRRSRYRTCWRCERLVPPESMAGRGLCGECAAQG